MTRCDPHAKPATGCSVELIRLRSHSATGDAEASLEAEL
jgi:hypothetical protein